jgi:hypothetical protein
VEGHNANPYSFVEDLLVRDGVTYRFGHRTDRFLNPHSRRNTSYLPNYLGPNYHGGDLPWIQAWKADEHLHISATFKGQLIDKCRVNPGQETPYDSDETLDESEWSVEGTCTVPKDWKPAESKSAEPKPEAKDSNTKPDLGPQGRKQGITTTGKTA